jgi:ectoine hydroxylase-related dioxygenase (phytanoyl-CoA dioxygenase family)
MGILAKPSLQPAGVDVRQYEADGVLVARQVFSQALIDELNSGWQAMKKQITEGGIERNARFVWGMLPEPVASLYRHASLVQAAQAILGTMDVALYMNRMLLKDEDWSGAVAIHQDLPYFSGGNKLSVFVPLTPTVARNGNGGLIFIKGSHKYGSLQRGTVRREVFPAMAELAPDLEVGDVVLMDFPTWHHFENAVIPGDRPLLQIAYQPSSDGSYGSAKLGVSEPTLVSGSWKTKYFAAWGESTIPDA